MQKLQEDPTYAEMAEREAETMEKVAIMLEKKAEGRPLPPEDYDLMSRFINRVEKRVEEKRREEDQEEKRRYEEALATVPELTFEIDILDVDLKEHILYILQEGGIETLGDLVLQMRLDPDKILAMNGIGPKSFEEIQELTDALRVVPEEPKPEEALTEEAPAPQVPGMEEEISQPEPEAVTVEVEGAAVVAEEPEEVEAIREEIPAKPVEVRPEEKAEKEEEDEFDKLFSYDASKYGYYESEKPVVDEDEDEDKRPTKKKKRKKPRPPQDDFDQWDEW
jgi:N utilization substance protein A